MWARGWLLVPVRAVIALAVVLAPWVLDVTRSAGSREGLVDAIVIIGGATLLALTSPWDWVRRVGTAYFAFDALLAIIGLVAAGWLVALANLAPYSYALGVLGLQLFKLVLWSRLGPGWRTGWIVARKYGPGVLNEARRRPVAGVPRRATDPSRGGEGPLSGEYLPPL
jgi:hypothetical protein